MSWLPACWHLLCLGLQVAGQKMNENLLEPLPPLPKLNRLVVVNDDLRCPSTLVKQWKFHPAFGQEFTAWLDQFCETYGVADEDVVPEAGEKRAQLAAEESPVKRQKVDDAAIIPDTGAIKEALLSEVSLVGAGKNPPFLQIRANDTIYIMNKSEQDVHIPALSYISAFGKGSFKMMKEGEEDMIEFKLTGHLDHVVLNGKVLLLGQVMQEQRAKNPKATVCYHDVQPGEANPLHIVVKQTHCVAFIPKKDGELSINNLASRVPPKVWNSRCLHIIWVVRWTGKGLMPVKPVVHLRGQLALKAGGACLASMPLA